MTDERKIITKEQYYRIIGDELSTSDYVRFWDDLPDAPKHTDEEVAEMEKAMHQLMDERHKLQVRIKELEAELSTWHHLPFKEAKR